MSRKHIIPGLLYRKCFHAKIAGCIPIYFADYHVHNDFRKESFINMYDYLEFEDLSKYLSEVKKDYSYLAKLANEPLLESVPNLNIIKDFLLKSITNIRK